MQFTKLAILIPFFATAALTNPVAEEAAPGQDVAAAELVGRDLQARGFGCPFNRNTCNTHCISLKGGRTGGYCAGKFRTTCTCVFG